MARLVCELAPGVELVRMVNSGTEAVMSAIRAAGVTPGGLKSLSLTAVTMGTVTASWCRPGPA